MIDIKTQMSVQRLLHDRTLTAMLIYNRIYSSQGWVSSNLGRQRKNAARLPRLELPLSENNERWLAECFSAYPVGKARRISLIMDYIYLYPISNHGLHTF